MADSAVTQDEGGERTETSAANLQENDAAWAKSSGLAATAIERFELNQSTGVQFSAVTPDGPQEQEQMAMREQQEQTQLNGVKKELRGISSDGAAEQKSMVGSAMMGGLMSMMTGAQQAASGAFALEGAKNLENEIAALNAASVATAAPTMTPIAPVPTGVPNAESGADTSPISGSGTDGASLSSASASASPSPQPDIGTGFNPGGIPSGLPDGNPSPGQFSASQPQNGSGAAQGGSAGLGSTGAGEKATEDPQPKLAAQGNNDNLYASGGGFSSGGGIAKPGGGETDFSGLLAKFLPKDDPKNPKSGILDFNGDGSKREGGPDTVYPPGVNLFEKISGAMSYKYKHGDIL